MSDDEQVKRLRKFGIDLVKVVHTPFRVKKYILGIKVVDEFKVEQLFTLLKEGICEKINEDISISLNNVSRLVQKNISTANMHKNTFGEFKNINQGKDIVLVATGPSVLKYKPIINAIHLGVNRAYQLEDIKFDYMFAQDYSAVKSFISELNEYRSDECKKFYGLALESFYDLNCVIPESDAIKANAYRYRVDTENARHFYNQFAYDITSQPLGGFGSVVFSAMQFLLWTNPAKIYLVGCDCSSVGHFDGQPSVVIMNDKVKDGWILFKEFAAKYYPETEIISINPVGLKGLFKDIYTEGEI